MSRRLQLLLAAALALAAGTAGTATDVLQRAELATVDARFDLRGEQDPPGNVVVVGIDARTLSELRVRPPIPRDLQARVVDTLRRAGAKVIAYDLEVVGETDTEDDNALFLAIRRAGNVVLAATQFDEDGRRTRTFGGDPETFRALRATVGSTNFPPDAAVGGVIRKVPLAEGRFPSFAVAVATAATGREPDPDRFEGGGAWIDFPGPAGAVGRLSFRDVLEGALRIDLTGRIAIVGAVEPGLQDISPTAAGAGVPGPEIQAAAIDTILRDFPLRDPPDLVVALLVAAAGALTPLSALWLRGLRWLPVPAGSLLALAVGAQLAFAAGTVLPVAAPAAGLLVALAATTVVAYATDLRERRRLREQFARFVGPDVVDAMVDEAGGEARLGGRRLDATVLFCDLRGFTTLAEQREPVAVIDLLNLYLAQMSDAILDHGGTVVTYLGDGIMAVFGAPLATPDHADRALAAAAEMLGPRLAAFAASAGLDAAPQLGVGICTGPVMSGTVGSARRLEYTAVGDTTNTAARLQSLTKELGVTSVVAASTRAALVRPDLAPALRELGPVTVRGRTEPVTAWTLNADLLGGRS